MSINRESQTWPSDVVHEITEPTIPQAAMDEAKRSWGYFPYRKCFIAVKDGEDYQVILKPTAHYARQLVRDGWHVVELSR